MAVDPKKKLEVLNSELQTIVKNYNEAKDVMTNCERTILQLQGGIAICEEIIREEATET